MPPDIQSRLLKDFGRELLPTIAGDITAWDIETKGLLDNRLLRAVVFLASGDHSEFLRLKNAARTNWTEVLNEAEFENGVRIRDFSKPFGQESV